MIMSRRSGGLFTGLILGTGLGMLFAPKKGSETRKDLAKKINEMLEKVKSLEVDDIKKAIEVRILDLKEELLELDKEKAVKIAKEKAKIIQEKAEDLYNLAVEKGTPILEQAAQDVKEKTIEFLNSTVDKLEKGEIMSKKSK